jgi:hemoglobin-like flavoprotein
MLDARQVELIKDSWAEAARDADAVTASFYQHLFTLDPGLRRLFPASLEAQREKLAQSLDFCIRNIGEMELLMPVLQRLGSRHAGYGVRPEHFSAVGAALLMTLRDTLGPRYSPELHEAWASLYGFVSREMGAALEGALG